MAAFAIGDVVVAQFPTTDFSDTKVRPALVLAKAEQDLLLCMITSKGYGDPTALLIPQKFQRAASLNRESVLRPTRILVVSPSVIKEKIGKFPNYFVQEVKNSVIAWINE